MPNQKGEAHVPVVRLMNRSGRSSRSSPSRWITASKSLANRASGKLRFLPGSAVQLEMVDAVVPDHVQAHLLEIVVVLGPLKAKPRSFVSKQSPGGIQPVLLGLAVASPGREPHAGTGSVGGGKFVDIAELVFEPFVELPERFRIVPPVVKKDGIQHGPALADQLFTVQAHGLRGKSFVIAVEQGVVPRVVIQKGSVGPRTLFVQVLQLEGSGAAGRERLPQHGGNI